MGEQESKVRKIPLQKNICEQGFHYCAKNFLNKVQLLLQTEKMCYLKRAVQQQEQLRIWLNEFVCKNFRVNQKNCGIDTYLTTCLKFLAKLIKTENKSHFRFIR